MIPSCTELTINDLESSCSYWYLMYCLPGTCLFPYLRDYLFGRGEPDSAVNKAYSEMFCRIILKTLVMEHFLSKVEELQTQIFN